MINADNLYKLYDAVILGQQLTTSLLRTYGFNSHDLTNLIKDRKLGRIKRGVYLFLSVDDLFNYGKSLISKNEYETATLCFERCYQLNPEHLGACFQLFFRSICSKDYKRAIELYEKLELAKNQNYILDGNFYLYLLNVITDIPEKYREFLKTMEYNDIKVSLDDKRYNSTWQHNRIRKSAFDGKFSYALQQLNSLIRESKYVTVQELLIKELLHQATICETKLRNKLLDLIRKKSYIELLSELEMKENRQRLSIHDNTALNLVRVILNIQKTKKIPTAVHTKTDNFYEALNNGNYRLALELSNDYNTKNNIDSSKSMVYLLLVDLCCLIDQIMTVEQSADVSSVKQGRVNNQSGKEDRFILNDAKLKLRYIKQSLASLDLDSAFTQIHNYLELIGKKEYELLAINLIKLDLIENEHLFTKTIGLLTDLGENKFAFHLYEYINQIHSASLENNLDKVKIYLNILSEINKLGFDELSAEKKIPIIDISESPKIDETESCDNLEVIKSNGAKLNSNLTQSGCDNRKFVADKYEQLLRYKAIILLKPMKEERIKEIHELVKEYPDMVSFDIGKGTLKRVVLRYNPKTDERINFKLMFSEGDIAYKEGRYNDCLNYYFKLLNFGEPSAYVYSKIGLTYLKLGKKRIAIDYLTIANEKDKRFAFDDLIDCLKGKTSSFERKKCVDFKLREFRNDVEDNCGIPDIDEITEFILDSGLDVESACEMLRIDEEDINIIRLIYARIYYSDGYYGKGNQFLKSVEKSESKTPTCIKMLNEIRQNKRFYINRPRENRIKLVLTLEPRKQKN